MHQDPDALGAVEPVVEPAAHSGDGGRDLYCVVAHPRSQKLGPTGWVKSLAAAMKPLLSTISGSCGSGRGAGPKITLAPADASNVDWWHGQRMWCVVCSYSATGQPTWVQIFE